MIKDDYIEISALLSKANLEDASKFIEACKRVFDAPVEVFSWAKYVCEYKDRTSIIFFGVFQTELMRDPDCFMAYLNLPDDQRMELNFNLLGMCFTAFCSISKEKRTELSSLVSDKDMEKMVSELDDRIKLYQ